MSNPNNVSTDLSVPADAPPENDAPWHDDARSDDSELQARRQHAMRAVVLASLLAVIALATRSMREPIVDAERVNRANTGRLKGLNPNTASVADLAALPGIGPTRAGAIVAYRERMRDTEDSDKPVFRSPDDLTGVTGIGPATAERLARWLYFDAP